MVKLLMMFFTGNTGRRGVSTMGDMDENWTEEDFKKLHESGLEGDRRAKLYRENREQWEREKKAREEQPKPPKK
jgi:hypothetical protein